MEKNGQPIQMPDHIYNWMKDFYDRHSHCTKYDGCTSLQSNIQASVIQGSAIGPASYVVTAADLQVIHDGNCLVKFADDTCLIVPARNSGSCEPEIAHIQDWAAENNLQLNFAKSKDTMFLCERQSQPFS